MAQHTIELDRPATAAPATASGDGRITWIGNATVLIEVAGLRILTDPNFLHAGDHAKLGGGLRSKRLHDPARELSDLLPVDVVILSHHHGDHWDEIADRDMPKDVPILTTAHAARKLSRSGFDRALALKVWESAVVTGGGAELTVTAVPGKHAPQPLDAVMPPVMGTVLDVRRGEATYRIYITGDTLLNDGLREIPRRHPDIDLALVHLGGTKVLGILLTMDGEQGAAALELVGPDHAIPIHYEEYTVMKSPLRDFDRAVERRNLRTQVHRLERGGTFSFEVR
jgi:L-ascorbate metabolism protein UlaG (beta-lactamase superfamily)